VLSRESLFENIFIQPAAGDAGGSIGAALAMHHIYFNQPRLALEQTQTTNIAYLGPEFSSKEINTMNKKFKAVFEQSEMDDAFYARIASYLADGKVVGWFQGRMEFGPRALGNRSILGDPRDAGMQRKLNLKIKKREGFRPFAPVVLLEDVRKYFELNHPSPYMLFVAPLVDSIRKATPNNYLNLEWKQKLGVTLSELPAITHVDFSARVQTLTETENQQLYYLLQCFKKETGCGVLINTSFNVRGEPMVCTPTDAYSCFMRTDMDVLVINNFVYIKENQPTANQKQFELVNFEVD
jgi:carbamoyltransferase